MDADILTSCSPPPEGLTVLTPMVYRDDRGLFFERFNCRHFAEVTGAAVEFVQDNQSRSVRGTLRGLHYQVSPSEQGKLVSCVRGSVFDVAVDIRRSSPTFSEWIGLILSDDNRKQLWVPTGFAHGFLALTEGAEVLYKTTSYYDQAAERSIRWDDTDIGIEWRGLDRAPLLADKDAAAPLLRDAETFR